MNPKIDTLLQQIRTLEEELEVQFALARAELHVRIEDGRVRFEQALAQRHRAMKIALLRYVLGARPLIALTAPVVYLLVVPIALLDLCVTIYQALCFPVYGITRVRRRDYLTFDRGHLAYLNGLEKLNCAYCSYANGVIAYVREVAARTEQYWCPIKHAQRVVAAHPRYSRFVDFGDADAYRAQLDKLRGELGEHKSGA